MPRAAVPEIEIPYDLSPRLRESKVTEAEIRSLTGLTQHELRKIKKAKAAPISTVSHIEKNLTGRIQNNHYRMIDIAGWRGIETYRAYLLVIGTGTYDRVVQLWHSPGTTRTVRRCRDHRRKPTYYCDCPDFIERRFKTGTECKHIAAVRRECIA